MRSTLLAALRRHEVLHRRDVLELVAEHVIDDALRAGAVIALLPGVYTLPSNASRHTMRRAALARLPRCAISHTDALDVWALPTSLGDSVRLTGPAEHASSVVSGVTVHRRRGFVAEPPRVVHRSGLRVVRLEQAIVESWSLLPDVDRRVPAIVAVRERRTTAARLQDCARANTRCKGLAEMRQVFSLAGAGLHSPLELWGHQHVFNDRQLPPARCQVPVDLPSGRVYLDRLYDDELVNVELDGAAYHGEPGQRERDLRRDAALAALGFVTVRFSHLRLHSDPDGVRAELMAVLAMRGRQLGLSAA
jgi:very-short-patch-repair endonuclease